MTQLDEDNTTRYTDLNFMYNATANFSHTARLFEQTWENFRYGHWESIDGLGGTHETLQWTSYNGTVEPWNWGNSSDRKEWLSDNDTNYEKQISFNFNLTSFSNTTDVDIRCENGCKLGNNSTLGLLFSIWDGILKGDMLEPVYLWHDEGRGKLGYEYTTNLTTYHGPPIDFVLYTQNSTDGSGETNVTVDFSSSTPIISENTTMDVWEQYLSGNYLPNVTYFDNGTTMLRFWNFTDVNSTVNDNVPEWKPDIEIQLDLHQDHAGWTNTTVSCSYATYNPVDLVMDYCSETLGDFFNGAPEG